MRLKIEEIIEKSFTPDEILKLEKEGVINPKRKTLVLKNLPDIFKSYKKQLLAIKKEIEFLEFVIELSHKLSKK